jgi:hypothetical protein
MIGMRSNLVFRKSRLNVLLGGNLDPIERVARYLRREQNLDPCSSWIDSYVDAPAIEPTEVANQRIFAYRKCNAWKVSVVLLTKCPEPFAGVGYNLNECLVMKK